MNLLAWGTPLTRVVGVFAVNWAIAGFVGGILFSGVLAIGGKRLRLDEISYGRFAAWGALASVLVAAPVSLLMGLTVDALVGFALVFLTGIGASVGSLALARCAEDRELLEQGERVLGIE